MSFYESDEQSADMEFYNDEGEDIFDYDNEEELYAAYFSSVEMPTPNYAELNANEAFGAMKLNESAADVRSMMSTSKSLCTPRSSVRPHGDALSKRLSPGQRKGTDLGEQKPKARGGGSRASMHDITYNVSLLNRSKKGALVDRGPNGGVAGSDVQITCKSDRSVNITGIDDHEMKNIPIGTVGAVVKSQHGDVIGIMHQYAIAGWGKTIHSLAQLEHHMNDVNDRSTKIKGGVQCIETNDGYLHPIDVINGLPYTPMQLYTLHRHGMENASSCRMDIRRQLGSNGTG